MGMVNNQRMGEGKTVIKQTMFLAAVLLVVSPVWAINKCTGADGKVTYQEMACANESKSAETVKTWDNSTSSRSEAWRFERKKDELTGKVSCFAMSPITYPKIGPGSKFIPVHAVVLTTGDTEVLGVRTSDDKNLFHNDVSGIGMKTDNGSFTPMSVKSGSHVVGVADSAAMIGALEKSKSLTVRVRFWPYDQLHDMEPISSAGFAAALRQTRACAKSS